MVATDFFSVSECKGQKTIDGEQVSLVLMPSGNDKVEALKANRAWVEAKVVSNSGVLLRGFDVRDVVEFNSIVEALGWPDIRYVGGDIEYTELQYAAASWDELKHIRQAVGFLVIFQKFRIS